jgi:hypothetical protein
VSTDWRNGSTLYLWEGDIVNCLSAEDCRAKAIDCAMKAETLEPRQKTAMLRYAEWWNRLAEYRAKISLSDDPPTDSAG